MNCQNCNCETESLHELGTAEVCENCFEDLDVCEECECLVEKNNGNNEYVSVCDDCKWDYNCPACGDVSENTGGSLCSCCEDEYFYCGHCDSLTDNYNGIETPDCTICEYCGRDGTVPEDSEYWYSYDDLYEHSNGFYYTYEEIIDGLKSYHSGTRVKLEGSDSGKYVGFELEVESENNRKCSVDKVKHEDLYLEQDGSLNHMGFEIITKYGDLNPVLELAEHIVSEIGDCCKSHYGENCGLHVHVSKIDCRMTNAKMLVFWNQKSNKDFVELFARRYDSQYCMVSDIGEEDLEITSNIFPRHSIVNVCFNTVEVRAFRGTLRLSTLLACIELAYYSYEYCKVCNGSRLHYSYFLQWLKGQDSNYIFPYLERKGKDNWIVNKETLYPTAMI